MTRPPNNRSADQPVRLCAVAYTHFETDPRVRREAAALVDAGFAVDVLALRRPGEAPRAEIEGVELFRLRQDRYRGASAARYIGSYLAFLARAGGWLARHARRRGVRLVHVHTMPDFMVFSALWPRLVHRLPVLLDIHDTMPEIFAAKFGCGPEHWKIRLLRWQEVRSARFASAVLTSEDTKADLLARHGIPRGRITVLLNLPDPRVFGPPAEAPMPEDPACFRLVYHGTLAHRLGLDIALRALAHVRAEMDALGPWRLEILGEGDARPALLALAHELGLGHSVRFSEGSVPVTALPGRLRGAALGIVPTRAQGDTAHMLPTKLLEYVHLGIPAVVRPTLTVRWYFQPDQVTGVDTDDPAAWGQAILALRRDPSRRRAQAEAALAWARTHRWEEHRRVLVELVNRLIG